jgi:hypothetical protein
VLVEQVPVFYVPITRTTGPRKARAIAVAASNKVRPTNLVEVGWDRAAYNVGRRAVTMLAKGRL